MAAPDDPTTSLARPEPTASASTEPIAREIEVALDPAQVLDAIARRPRMVERKVGGDQRHDRKYFDGVVFHERTEDGLVLWRRPDRLWVDAIRGQLESVPYPDCLHVSVRATARGSRVMMRWQRHPLTRSSLRFNLIVGALFVLLMSQVGDIGLLALLGLGALLIPVARMLRIRRARTSLLRAAYEALTPHELGEADRENSAFRAALPSGRTASPRLSDDDS